MRGLFFDGRLHFREDLEIPVPQEGEALVRVRCAGICRTDLEIVKGYMGFQGIPGHEFIGVVEKAPEPSWIGKRVTGEINCPCRVCPTCQAGRPNHCPNRTVLGIAGRNGAFAEYLTLPLTNLYSLPDTLADEQAVFTEPLAACFEILEQVDLQPSMKVAVVGDGRLGLLAVQVLSAAGIHPTLIGRHREHLDLAAAWKVKGFLEGEVSFPAVFDVVIDCSGSPDGFHLARSLVRPRGRLILKSTFASSLEMDLSSLVVDEITLIGSRCGPFAPAIEGLARGEFSVQPLITARYPLDKGVEAFQKASKKGALKILFLLQS